MVIILIKKYLFNILWFFIIIFVCSILITLLHYFSIFKSNTINTIKLIIPIIAILVTSFRIGMSSNKKGYLEGLKFGSIIIVLIFILSLIFSSFKVKSLVFYLILLITSMLGSMIGITKKR